MQRQNIITIEASKTRRDVVYFDTSEVRKRVDDEGRLQDALPSIRSSASGCVARRRNNGASTNVWKGR
jgi:hypothetical protein